MADLHHTLVDRVVVAESGCMEWTACRIKDGYGMMRVGPKMKLAHRVSYELSIAAIPDGLLVLHRCDNPPCINPDHLFIGTDQDNSNDKLNKGRSNFGQKNGRNKLSPEQVLKIRKDTRIGSVLAIEYGVRERTIWAIRHRLIWKHLP